MKLRKLQNTTTLEFYTADLTTELEIPFMDTGISAGFPSPADDFLELSIDLNKHLIKHKDSTFFAKVKGHSMKNAGIFDGDLLVIDKSLAPQDGKIAICQIDGEFTVKRIKIEKEIVSRYYFQKGKVQLTLDNDPEVKEAISILKDSNRYKKILAIK